MHYLRTLPVHLAAPVIVIIVPTLHHHRSRRHSSIVAERQGQMMNEHSRRWKKHWRWLWHGAFVRVLVLAAATAAITTVPFAVAAGSTIL